MKVGLIDIEPWIFNTAYMQISHHHKMLGDSVEWAMPLRYDDYDILYCSSLFDYTDKSQVPQRAICGGTGFDRKTKLPFDCELDYSIYPNCKTSYIWFSRGCPRNCPWCVVRRKEGYLTPVPPKNLNPRGESVTVMDNSFFASINWGLAMLRLREWGLPVDFQGIDIRTINEGQCRSLNILRHHKQIKFAWDDPHEDLTPQLKMITKIIKPWKLMCYVLIGYYTEPTRVARGFDLYRVNTLRRFGIDPFVMPYDRTDPYQKDFARYVNHKAVFNSINWKDYQCGFRKGSVTGYPRIPTFN